MTCTPPPRRCTLQLFTDTHTHRHRALSSTVVIRTLRPRSTVFSNNNIILQYEYELRIRPNGVQCQHNSCTQLSETANSVPKVCNKCSSPISESFSGPKPVKFQNRTKSFYSNMTRDRLGIHGTVPTYVLNTDFSPFSKSDLGRRGSELISNCRIYVLVS